MRLLPVGVAYSTCFLAVRQLQNHTAECRLHNFLFSTLARCFMNGGSEVNWRSSVRLSD
jgi:hypothetical protein